MMPLATVSLTTDPAPPWSLPGIGPVLLAMVALGIVALTLWTYRGANVPARRKAAVIALRLLALLVAILTVLRPALAIREDERVPSTLVVALDASKSMS